MHKSTRLALVLSVLAILPACAETWLLGGALAADISDDEQSGLVNLSGIQSSVFEVDVPYVADLWVYLRWEGEGKHSVLIEVLSPDGEVVNDVSGDVDFEEYGTNFTTHRLENTVFEDDGTYVVVISVDGEELLELPYCVNDDRDVADGPYLLLSLPAVDGWLDETGRGEVEGAFEHYTFKRFPDADDFSIITLWFSGDDSFQQRIEIAGPDGKVLRKSERQQFQAWPGELAVVTTRFENFLFTTSGDYRVTLFLGDEEQLSYLLRVAQAR